MKKKILFCITTLQGGGAERTLVDTVKYLKNSDCSITVFSILNTGIYIDEIKKYANYDYGIDFNAKSKIHLFFNKVFFYIFRKLPSALQWRIFIHDKYDVEIAYMEGIPTRMIAASPIKLNKKYAWVHCDLLENHASDNFYWSENEQIESYKKFDRIFSVSQSTREAFKKRFNLDSCIQLNVVDVNEIIKKSLMPVDDILHKEKKFTVISIGRLTEQKAYDRLLKVHKRLIANGFCYRLVIIGEGPDKNKLNKYIEENDLRDTVDLIGFKNNPYPYIKEADLYICASRYEGLSISMSEAVILGVPVLSTRCSGAEELLGDSVYGLVVDNSEDGIYNGMVSVLGNVDTYTYYKKMVMERRSYFSIEQRIDEYKKILEC